LLDTGELHGHLRGVPEYNLIVKVQGEISLDDYCYTSVRKIGVGTFVMWRKGDKGGYKLGCMSGNGAEGGNERARKVTSSFITFRVE